jgi:general secretion pathway protein E
MTSKTSYNITKRFIKKISEKKNLHSSEIDEHWQSAVSKKVSFSEQVEKAGLFEQKIYQKMLSDITGINLIEAYTGIDQDSLGHFVNLIPIRYVKKYHFVPFQFDGNKIIYAVSNLWPSDPYEKATLDLGYESYSLVLDSEENILERINQIYDRNSGTAEEAAEVLEGDEDLNYLNEFSSEETEDLLDVEDEEPIKKLMNSILFQSVKDSSSDIHIDPSTQETTVRYRIDGILHQITKVPKQAHIPLVNRIKVMAGLDISTKNQTQDGRTMILLAGRKIDIRVSIIPTIHGERAVMRLLNQSKGIISLENLGMNREIATQIEDLIRQPHGIILVTGPTGSGKTTTLYSALNKMNAQEKNIVTIEDPVEYRIAAYGQMQVNEKVGVTFSKGLRAMLRQDPDVIMVGEMRDTETAKIAIQASLTGHLVLSTVHTNDSISTIIRLIDMGIEPFLVTSTLSAILAQRLIRKICPHCKEQVGVLWEVLEKLNFQKIIKPKDYSGQLWQGRGCEKCLNTGYSGRTGIYELLILNDQLRKAVQKSADATQIKKVTLEQKMKTLQFDCAQKVLEGTTTIDEMLRVVYSDQNPQEN